MTGWRVRRADCDEASRLADIEKAAFGNRGWGADGVAGGFGAVGVEILVASLPGAAPDGLAIWRALPGEAEILSIGVTEKARGRGAGAALLDAVIAAARSTGADAIFLEVDPANAAALRLYSRAGFTETARRKAYYRSGADAVIMRKTL